MKTVTGKITGTPLPGSWAQVIAFSAESQVAAVREIPLFAALDIRGPSDFEIAPLGKEILSVLEENFFRIDKEPPFLALKRAVIASFRHLEAVVSSENKNLELEFNLVAASIANDILYLAQLGEGQVWFWRQQALGKILAEPTSEVKLASGPIKVSDVAILGTPRFFQLVSIGELRAALAGGEIAEAIDGLAPKIHAAKESSSAAVLFIKMEKEEEETTLPQFEPSQPIYIRHRQIGIKKHKSLLLAAMVLTVLLALSVIKGVGRKDFSSRYTKLETLLTRAEEKYKMATSLSDLNPAVSRDYLQEAKGLLREAEELKIKSAKFGELSEKVAGELAKVSKVFEVKQPEVFFDFNSIAKEASGQVLTRLNLGLLIVDSQKESIYKVDLVNHSGQVITSSKDFTEAKFICDSFVFTSQGIFQFDLEGGKVRKVVEPGDWEKILGMSTYGGNIYLLDASQNQIVKYIGLEGGFSAPRNYLTATESPDFSNVQDLTIDGWVYVLKKDGTVLKYLQGAQEFFAVTGLDPALSNPVALYTDAETDYLYILDQGGTRIVVLTKTGDYHCQYVSDVLTDATDLAVDEKEKAIYVLKGSKIYRIELKS